MKQKPSETSEILESEVPVISDSVESVPKSPLEWLHWACEKREPLTKLSYDELEEFLLLIGLTRSSDRLLSRDCRFELYILTQDKIACNLSLTPTHYRLVNGKGLQMTGFKKLLSENGGVVDMEMLKKLAESRMVMEKLLEKYERQSAK